MPPSLTSTKKWGRPVRGKMSAPSYATALKSPFKPNLLAWGLNQPSFINKRRFKPNKNPVSYHVLDETQKGFTPFSKDLFTSSSSPPSCPRINPLRSSLPPSLALLPISTSENGLRLCSSGPSSSSPLSTSFCTSICSSPSKTKSKPTIRRNLGADILFSFGVAPHLAGAPL